MFCCQTVLRLFTMKRITSIAIAFTLLVSTVSASNSIGGNTPTPQSSSIHYINAPRFVRPLIEKWITEYKKIEPQTDFAIAKTAADKKRSALSIKLSDHAATSSDSLPRTVYFGSYAILPVTAQDSEAAQILSNQKLNAKRLKSLFFENEEEENGKADKKKSQVVVYTGTNTQSVAQVFAAHFGKEASKFRGKRIVGDDQFLNTALLNDKKGISLNAIGNVYDLKTRQLKAGLQVLNLDVDKNKQSAFLPASTLDDLISTLESSEIEAVPVETIGLSFSETDIVSAKFAAWVLKESGKFNHQYGLLRLNDKLVAQQAKELTGELTAQK